MSANEVSYTPHADSRRISKTERTRVDTQDANEITLILPRLLIIVLCTRNGESFEIRAFLLKNAISESHYSGSNINKHQVPNESKNWLGV